ncbi:hemin ABC transporter substrate-binding protein [Leadbetterella sp. DM7]|uniref:heme/hemin ABC transporter substrate-binding protein n=1 Tax=Leadbetterella sp. DM7 TaxID=3235085 RepID=UPI00349E985A
MKKIILSLALLAGLAVSCNTSSEKAEEKSGKKIVSLSGAVTETIAALGGEDQLVGVDVTSTFPESVKTHASDLGHIRSITLEPIVALQPDVVVAGAKEFNPELQAKLKEAGIEVKLVEQEYSAQGAKNLIHTVGELLGKADTKSLTDKIDADLAQVKPFEKAPKVLFIYARGAGTLMVAGDKTPFTEVVKLAGGENAVTGFEDFKPLTPEALVQGNPDVILLFDSGLASLGGIDGLLAVPGVAQTTAGKNKAIISLDGGLISNFGPRTGEAALALNKALAEKVK